MGAYFPQQSIYLLSAWRDAFSNFLDLDPLTYENRRNSPSDRIRLNPTSEAPNVRPPQGTALPLILG